MQDNFCERATNYRDLLWKLTYEDKASYGSSPPRNRHFRKTALSFWHSSGITVLFGSAHIRLGFAWKYSIGKNRIESIYTHPSHWIIGWSLCQFMSLCHFYVSRCVSLSLTCLCPASPSESFLNRQRACRDRIEAIYTHPSRHTWHIWESN